MDKGLEDAFIAFIRAQQKSLYLLAYSYKQDTYSNLDLEQALYHLPVQLREVIVLHYFEDLKLEDVAPGYMGIVKFEIPTAILEDVLVSGPYIQ